MVEQIVGYNLLRILFAGVGSTFDKMLFSPCFPQCKVRLRFISSLANVFHFFQITFAKQHKSRFANFVLFGIRNSRLIKYENNHKGTIHENISQWFNIRRRNPHPMFKYAALNY